MDSDVFVSIRVKPSHIDGVGVFSDFDIPKNINIGRAVAKNNVSWPYVTQFGSKINHSFTPNTHLVEYHDEYYLVSSQFIPAGTEITANYNATPWFIEKAKAWYR